MRICTIPQCENAHERHGVCKKHARKIMREGLSSELISLGITYPLGPKCSAEDCDRYTAISSEITFCEKHLKYIRKYGVPKTLAEQGKSPYFDTDKAQLCKINGCDALQITRENCRRHSVWTHRYNLTNDQANRLLNKYPSCQICDARLVNYGKFSLRDKQKGSQLAIDHNHDNDILRGVLCASCNIAIGGFEEDKGLLRSAKEYLTRPELNILSANPPNVFNKNCVIKSCDKNIHQYEFLCSAHAKSAKTYNLTFLELVWIRNHYMSACEICDQECRRFLTIDHSHATGKVRGLLCNRCNINLGHARDSVAVIDSMIAYLENPPYPLGPDHKRK